MVDLLQETLEKRFGFKAFRLGQREAIEALLTHGSILSIQPTGHGKSLLYQLPSCLLPHLTIVISPLLALMRDQIDHLENRFQIKAAAINSDQTEEESALAKRAAYEGKIKVLFVSPEQLDHLDRFAFFLSLPTSLIVIDEAHCISTWGHDFRPSYRQIVKFVQARAGIKVLALTATANQAVEQDIKAQLGSDILVFRESMNRPNIALYVAPAKELAEKLEKLTYLLKNLKGSGIVYCSTRESTTLVSDYLKDRGILAPAYHAGLPPEEKRALQTAFTRDQIPLIVATTALGMGIDKPNIRFIVHFDIPGSITSYYQEVGRCGRDGERARGILLYDPQDKKVQDYFIESALPTQEDFAKVVEVVAGEEEEKPPNLTLIKRLTGLHPTRVALALAELTLQGILTKVLRGSTQCYQIKEAREADLTKYQHQYEAKKRELSRMIQYATLTQGCRMAALRLALGDYEPLPCGQCDLCRQKPIEFPQEETTSALAWLSGRPLPIEESRKPPYSSGLSLLDGKLRTPLFIRFMKSRGEETEPEAELMEKLLASLKHLAPQAIIFLPSRSWKGREKLAALLAKELAIPCLTNLIRWKEEEEGALPPKRQGELLNNDQRRHNVDRQMELNPNSFLPQGKIVLFDDYIGSGATMREGARALREKSKEELIPFTIVAVKWRLGQPGFV